MSAPAAVNTALVAHLKTRRSTPFALMQGPGPDDATLDAMLEIAARVPDHGKLAPWRFMVIGPDAGKRLGEALERIILADDPAAPDNRREIERARFLRAPVCVAVISRAAPHPKIPEWEQVLSAGAVCLNLLHAATAHGFGATWITEWPSMDRRFLDHLGLEAHETIAGFVHIGTPSARAEERVRPDMSAIITRL